MESSRTCREAIFVHSLFRSGSTYVLEVFRRSPGEYWCYQEPLHERLLEVSAAPEVLHENPASMATRLRHSPLSRPYFEEFTAAEDRLPELLSRELIYDTFFSSEARHTAALARYFEALAAAARGRPVFQECRTFARVPQLVAALGGTHLYLWRNPRDQWWSHKVDAYFDAVYLLALNARERPPLVQALRQQLAIPEFHDVSLAREREFFGAHLPNAEDGYLLFYSLWWYGMAHGRPACAMDLNIDRLATSASYRAEALRRLDAAGVHGLDFSDCAVPQAAFGPAELEFFDRVEARAHELIRGAGLGDEIPAVTRLRSAHEPDRPAADGNAAALRQQLLLSAQDNARLHRRLYELEELLKAERAVYAGLRRDLDELHRSLPWRLSAPLRSAYRMLRAWRR